MKPQHTPEECDLMLSEYATGDRWWAASFGEINSLRHYLAEYRRLAAGKPLLADGTVAVEGDTVWHRGREYFIDDDGDDCACAVDDGGPPYLAMLSECHRTREASMEAKP